jgi:hypothetical protein
VKNAFRILLIVAVLGVALAGIFTARAAVTVAEDDVEWAATNGDDISWVTPDTTAFFFIEDDALETTKTGTATWSGTTAAVAAGINFRISDGFINGATTTATYALAASDYSTGTPTGTPLTGFPVVDVEGERVTVTSSNLTAGTFKLLTSTSVSDDAVASFSYHVADSWSSAASATRRAKVTSTSDPAGEFVTINEVASLSSTAASNPTSQIFRGSIALSSDAATQGTNSDGIWVQDGDTLTVSYLDSAGATVDSDTVTVDGVKPTISAIAPADGTVTNVVNPTITFEVTDSGSGITTTNPGTVVTISVIAGGSAAPTATTTIAATAPAFQSIADGFRVIYTTGTSWLTLFSLSDGSAFTWQIEATDVAGNTKTLTGSSLDATIDITDPTVSSAVTGIGWNSTTALEVTDQNTSVKVTFSEDVDASSVDASDFTVAGVQPSAVVVGTTTSHKNFAYLTVAAQAADAKPEVVVTGEVLDLAGNDVNLALTTDTATATDGLDSTLTVTVSQALAIKADAVKTTVSTDEKLAVAGLTVSVNGPTASTGNGTLTTSAPTPLSNEGTFTVVAGDATGAYGVSISATDLGSNAVNNLTTVTAEVVAAASITPAVGVTVVIVANGPIADADFDGDVDADDITSLSFSAYDADEDDIVAVDASARTISVTTSGTAPGATETVTVTYKYAKNSFEVDVSAPTVTFTPAGGSTIQNQSPYVRLQFDEDEYPGDTFKTVTLTKAELTNPDATTLDLLASFESGDSIEFIWASSDLVLGAYTLTVSATDTAGNKLTDASAKFTIEARALHSISLRPGWNLVSLPGTPADSAINSVITNAKVDTVLTYDPTVAGGWLTAVRDADGTLTGTLTDIDASKGIWIHTSSFDPLKVDIPGLSEGAAVLPPSFPLLAGWNLVPVATLDLTDTTIDADEYFTGLDWSRAYGYDNATSTFSGKLPDTADTVSVGQGYWIFLNKTGTLVP